MSNESGTDQVYISRFLTPRGRSLLSAGRGTEPAWMSTNELAFINNAPNRLTLVRLQYGASAEAKLRAQFDTRNHCKTAQGARQLDLSPHGTWVICVKSFAEAATGEAMVVQNWAVEAKRLMAAEIQ